MIGSHRRYRRLSSLVSFVLAGCLALVLMVPQQAQGATAAELQASASATLDKLNALQDRFDEAAAKYTTAEMARAEAQAKKEEAQAKVEEATLKIEDLQDKLGTRARGMYRSGALSILDVLTSSATFRDFTNNWDLLNDMNQTDADMVQETKDLRAVVEEQEAEAATQEEVEAKKTAEAQADKDEAERLVNETQAIYDSLSAEAAAAVEAERQARQTENARAFEENLANAGYGNTGNAGGANGSTSTSSSNAGSSSGGSSASPSYTPGTVLSRAWSKVGNARYVYGGTGPDEFDCSGFVGWCLTGSTVRLGTDAYFGSFPIAADPQPGDVCYRPGHVGIYIGNGQMINASSPSRGICVDSLDSRYTIHRM